jgi:hypothetical protein
MVDSEHELKSTTFTVLEDVAILRLHPDSATKAFLFVVYARVVYLSFYLKGKSVL